MDDGRVPFHKLCLVDVPQQRIVQTKIFQKRFAPNVVLDFVDDLADDKAASDDGSDDGQAAKRGVVLDGP